MIIPVILAGGSGTRMWPMSRELFPKQLLRLIGSHTMLQQTLLRVGEIKNAAAPVLICNGEHRYPIAEQIRELDSPREPEMILEPVGRNTAPAVAIAAMKAISIDPEARILVLPADHLIGDTDAFCRAVYTADRYAIRGYLITFGVIPDCAETGYGYIRKGRALGGNEDESRDTEICAIDQFVEKPDKSTAEKYLASGRYCWNSGMFLFRAADVYEELHRFVPEIISACRRAWQWAVSEDGALCLDHAVFAQCPSDSIDYAVMEKTDKGVMIPFQADWSDLGSWDAMWEAGSKDADGNVVKGEVIARELKNSLVFSDRRLVAALGMEESIVIDTPDALLVADRSRSQDVKSVVETLKAENRREVFRHETTYLAWGSETRIAEGKNYMIRQLSFQPSKKMEFIAKGDRMVYWTVVAGAGYIKKDGSAAKVRRGVCLEISRQSKIEVENTGSETLVIIEVGVQV